MGRVVWQKSAILSGLELGHERELDPGTLRDQHRCLELTEVAVHRVLTYFFDKVHAKSRTKLGSINLRVGSTPHIAHNFTWSQILSVRNSINVV
jgi:hypothetical protein